MSELQLEDIGFPVSLGRDLPKAMMNKFEERLNRLHRAKIEIDLIPRCVREAVMRLALKPSEAP